MYSFVSMYGWMDVQLVYVSMVGCTCVHMYVCIYVCLYVQLVLSNQDNNLPQACSYVFFFKVQNELKIYVHTYVHMHLYGIS
jgi:hypothetical protein